jgi:hypothetical protein
MTITIDTNLTAQCPFGGQLSPGITIGSGVSLLLVGVNCYGAGSNIRLDSSDGTDGTPLSSAGGVSAGFAVSSAQLFYLVNPSAGAHTIWTPNTTVAWLMTLKGTDTSTPFGTMVTSGSGTPYGNPESLTVSSPSGGLVVDVLGCSALDAIPTPNGSQTVLANDATDSGGALQLNGSYKFGSGSVTMSWSGSGIIGAAIAVAINPASGSPSPVTGSGTIALARPNLSGTSGSTTPSTITVDAIATGTTPGNDVLTSSITVGSLTNGILIVGLNCYDGVTAVRLDSSSGTLFTEFGGAIAAFHRVAQWFYLLNPPSGSHNIYVDGNFGSGYAISFSGVHQTTPFGTEATTAAFTNPESLTVTSPTNGVVIDILGFGVGDGTPVKDASQTIIANDVLESTFSGARLSGSYKAGSGSVTMTWSGSAIAGVARAVPLQPAGVSGGPSPVSGSGSVSVSPPALAGVSRGATGFTSSFSGNRLWIGAAQSGTAAGGFSNRRFQVVRGYHPLAAVQSFPSYSGTGSLAVPRPTFASTTHKQSVTGTGVIAVRRPTIFTPSSGAYPNEPAGFTLLTHQTFDSTLVNSGFDYNTGVTLVDLAATGNSPYPPVGNTNVAQWFFFAGLPGGTSPANYGHLSYPQWQTVKPRQQYQSFWIRLSDNWAPPPETGAQKLNFIFIDKDGGNHLGWAIPEMSPSLSTDGPAPNWTSYTMHHVLEDIVGTASGGTGTVSLTNNIYPGDDARNLINPHVWNRLESLIVINTPGLNYDGICRWWVNGVLLGDHTDICWTTDTDANVQWGTDYWSPTYGGATSPCPNDQYMWVKDIYISGAP